MITQDIISNINKIDFDLKNLFESVKIEEKTLGNQFYFEIDANSTFFNINESMEWKKAQVVVKIDKRDLSSNFITWSYKSNPTNESSNIVERVSKIENIALDIYNVIVEKRMDKEYFSNLETVEKVVNESLNTIEPKSDLVDLVKESLTNFGVIVDNVEIERNTSSKLIKLFIDKNLKVSEKFIIESSINSNSGVEWTVFKDGLIEIHCSN